jgi:hypothetical protein
VLYQTHRVIVLKVTSEQEFNMRWIGYFDVSVFWLAVLLVVTFSIQPSNIVVFENKSVLMENITSNNTVSGCVSGTDHCGEVQNDAGVRAVLTSDGSAENGYGNYCSAVVPSFYGETESATVLIVY